MINPLDDGPQDVLKLSDPGERPAVISKLEPIPKSPGLAFGLSLLVPGLGQLYCGEGRRAWWTFLPFATGVALVIWLSSSLAAGEERAGAFWGMGFRTALVLYAFGFLDAYFTAREKSTGMHHVLEYNPRVGAVLNLVTRGFGYWYLDDRKKGVLLFILLGIASRASLQIEDKLTSNSLGLFVELVLAGMAVDAYRLAKKKNQKWEDAAASLPKPLLAEGGLQPGVPIALAGLMAVGYVGFISLAFVMPDTNQVDQSKAVIRKAETGNSYVNNKYGIEFHVPPHWELDNSEKGFIVQANAPLGLCNVALLSGATLPFISAQSIEDGLIKDLQQQIPGAQVVKRGDSPLAGFSAREIRIEVKTPENDDVVHQSYFTVRKGFLLYTLVETIPEWSSELCAEDLKTIRSRLVLSK
jgi:TM2 domain-containing membrane protein YozV